MLAISKVLPMPKFAVNFSDIMTYVALKSGVVSISSVIWFGRTMRKPPSIISNVRAFIRPMARPAVQYTATMSGLRYGWLGSIANCGLQTMPKSSPMQYIASAHPAITYLLRVSESVVLIALKLCLLLHKSTLYSRISQYL